MAAGQTILRRGGVIRGLANWGVFALPSRASKFQQAFRRGHYFVLRYDAPAPAHAELRANLAIDPRMLRAAHVRLGDGTLASVASFADVKWDRP